MSIKKVTVAGDQFIEICLYFHFTQREHGPNESSKSSSYCTHRNLFAKHYAAYLHIAKNYTLIQWTDVSKNNKKGVLFKRNSAMLFKMI